MRRTWIHGGCALLAGLLLRTAVACADDAAHAGEHAPPARALDAPDAAAFAVDADADLFAPDRITDIALTLASEDWDAIRVQGRSTNEVYSGCLDPAFAYTTVRATARIDGVTVAPIGVRKKGFLGSLSTRKPSLRLDFNSFDARQTFRGRKDLTLNNSRSDASLAHQCLAYGLFTAAGIAAPRCGFARVSVNGVDLGVYVDVEPPKKPFLRRHFRDPEGNLYEGSLYADFRVPNLTRFEKKTNEKDPSQRDLEQLAAALEHEGAALVAELAPILDLEAFYRFWAMETLTGHYNGYTGSLNNFMLYHDPESGKFHFIPWGTDGAFMRTNTYLPRAGVRPVATSAWGRLPERLFAYEPTRARYREVLRELLDTVWSELAIVSQIDRMESLLEGHASRSMLASLRNFVVTRRADIERELAAPDVLWTLGERPISVCAAARNTAVRGSFAAARDAAPVSAPETTLSLVIDGVLQTFTSVAVSVGRLTSEHGTRGPAALTFVGRWADGGSATLRFDLGGSIPSAPGTRTLHGFESLGMVYVARGTARARFVGYVGEGTVTFEQAGAEPGAAMVGHFEGEFLQTQPSQPDATTPADDGVDTDAASSATPTP